METKTAGKKNKIMQIATVINSLAIIALAIIVAGFFKNTTGNDMAGKNKTDGANIANNQKIKKPAPIPVKDITITISDNGYDKRGFSIQTGEKIQFQIANNGQNAHSFKIDDLNLDSGIIEPGQTKTITTPAIPIKAKNYRYYSDPDKNNESFNGIMMAVE